LQESFFTKKSELKKVVLSVLSHKPNNNTKFVPKPGFVKPEQESFFTKKSELKKVVLSVLSHKPNNNTKFVPKPGFVKPFFFPQNDFGFAIQAAPREDRTYMIQASRQHK
jgi:hypothetical protein